MNMKALAIAMIHSNPARIVDDHLIIDRKFHSGMLNYVKALVAPIVTVHPEARGEAKIMDPVQVPVASLPYRVLIVKTGRSKEDVAPDDRMRLRQEIESSGLLYGATRYAAKIARSLQLPYIMVLEYDLLTQIAVATATTKSPLKKIKRIVHTLTTYALSVRDMRAAYCLHCNGFPIYDETRWFNSNRLLYLDSRISEEQVIPAEQLEDRLADRSKRKIRLLFSGRYEKIKGALDAVRVAVECARMGLPVEMHCYGQGSLAPAMRELAQTAAGQVTIVVHDAIPYPELVRVARTFDLFVCCHIQSDPSCTYIESFGAGLPIVGYGNRMWRRLSDVSGVGRYSRLHDHQAVARSIADIIQSPALIDQMSRRAREFALDHCFEREFRLRTDAINGVLENRNL